MRGSALQWSGMIRPVLAVVALVMANACGPKEQARTDSTPAAQPTVGTSTAAQSTEDEDTTMTLMPPPEGALSAADSAEESRLLKGGHEEQANGSNKKCSTSSGPNDHTPASAPPANGGDYWQYVNGLCFVYDKYTGHKYSELKQRGPKKVPMWIMPEKRMHRSSPSTVPTGMGLVVGKAYNNSSSRKYSEPGWSDSLPGYRNAYIWYGKSGDAVLFMRGTDGKVLVLKRGSWRQDQNPNYTNPKAQWDHPTIRKNDSVVVLQPGTGWVSCLGGCCTAGDLFQIE